MNSCALLFMLWLGKFENANCCSNLGSFGWFIVDKRGQDSEPFSGWFDFDQDSKRMFGDGIRYKKGMTNYFSVTKIYQKMDKTDLIIDKGVCKLNGKRYKYQEYILDGKIK